jgi:4-amino-4-deoxy-L-arabinose transferase-like glycosyltransferase
MALVRTSNLTRVLLAAIVIVYVAIGALYAALTPAWQVPDEPAHYNYVESLAEGEGFPVLEPSDYDQELLGELTSRGFPPELSTEPLEYEDHQPPLYYLLATPVFLLFDGMLLPIRLVSVLLGAALLLVAFGVVRAVFPSEPAVALAATAFIAFLPQHVAMTAGVNNDVLGELVVAGALLLLVRYVSGGGDRPWVGGLVLGLGLLTKTTAYISLGTAAVSIAIRWRRERHDWRWAASQAVWMLIPALLLSAAWFARNGLTYGWPDLLGLGRHADVVAGQPRTSEWLAEFGWLGLVERLVQTTFRSFWGQFGWMGVPLPTRLYQLLTLLDLGVLGGFVWWLLDRRRPRLTASQRAAVALLVVSCTFTVLAFLWYNLTFVQHQGRYLFPALIPIGSAVALGLTMLASVLPRRVRGWSVGAVFVAMALLDVYVLLRVIVPALES